MVISITRSHAFEAGTPHSLKVFSLPAMRLDVRAWGSNLGLRPWGSPWRQGTDPFPTRPRTLHTSSRDLPISFVGSWRRVLLRKHPQPILCTSQQITISSKASPEKHLERIHKQNLFIILIDYLGDPVAHLEGRTLPEVQPGGACIVLS